MNQKFRKSRDVYLAFAVVAGFIYFAMLLAFGVMTNKLGFSADGLVWVMALFSFVNLVLLWFAFPDFGNDSRVGEDRYFEGVLSVSIGLVILFVLRGVEGDELDVSENLIILVFSLITINATQHLAVALLKKVQSVQGE
ncbi:hypothetical protein KRX51_02745 [Corynebacterium sp. TAE3-ERU12]|uniref:hypothetical protein n=1 Tax=Corynebacterium sp. TAE3-ERU12 TaxID=2849491 RepID=UPI001C448D26|nr:hypothetical protein [Corynebacterium sp. TAE3-ERU12]MBV7294840.1 hypothetical protein [Corynebacterium sp. TAE3-ERU12]